MRNVTLVVATIGLLLLVGCVADQKGRIEQGNGSGGGKNTPPNVEVKVAPSEPQDLSEVRRGLADLRTDIASSSNNTANQFSGLLNTSVSKLAEQLTGLESNISELVKLTATMNNTANVELKNKLEATASAVADVKASFQAVANLDAKFDAKMEAHANLLSQIDVALGKIETSLNANANAQVGFNNSFDQKMERMEQTISAQAGRDVNMYPPAAVYTVLGCVGAFVVIIAIIASVLMVGILNAYKASRQRQEARTEAEKDERMRYERLLMKALSMLPEGDLNSEISRELGIKPRPPQGRVVKEGEKPNA